jgi:hypothetical protein
MHAATFHMNDDSEKDRMLIAIDVASDRRHAVALSRRVPR